MFRIDRSLINKFWTKYSILGASGRLHKGRRTQKTKTVMTEFNDKLSNKTKSWQNSTFRCDASCKISKGKSTIDFNIGYRIYSISKIIYKFVGIKVR